MVIEAIGAREQGRRFAYTERHLHKMERDVPTWGPVTGAAGNRLRVNGASRQNRCDSVLRTRSAALPSAIAGFMGGALRYLDKKPIRGWRFLGFRSGFFLAYQSAGV